MKARLLAVAAVSVFAASPMMAQSGGLSSPVCPSGSTNALGIPDQTRAAQDACQQAYDVFQFMAPQLGVALAGGNATLGKGSTLGGLGHFSVGLRANVFNGQLPDVTQFQQSVNGAQQRNLPSKSQLMGLPTVDGALGIFKGIPLAVTNILGIDLLASAAYVPTFGDSTSDLSVKPQQNLQIGYGARIGLLEESLVVPGVAITYLKRDLPKTDIVGKSGSASLHIDTASVETTAWRVVASKSLIVFGLAVGYGQDKYTTSASVHATINSTYNGIPVQGNTTIPATEQTMTRSNMFADLSLNLPLFKLVGEVGQVSGGTVNTYNSFSGGRADRSIQYASVGLRLAW